MPEEYPGQYGTAYHEAGHAVSAINCPDGCVKYIDICNREENDKENGATVATIRDADESFQLYAGPWAEAKFLASGGSIDSDYVFDLLRANRDDWIAFQRSVGNQVGESEWNSMHWARMGIGEPAGPEYRPPEEWHDKAHGALTPLWESGEIQALAMKMLAREKNIELNTGQLLEREGGRDRWKGLGYKQAPNEGDGLVGPPPPFLG